MNEPDSPAVREVLLRSTRRFSSALCLAEVAAVLHRHVREGGLSRKQALALHDLFLDDIENQQWVLIPVSESLLRKVGVLVRKLEAGVFLRAADAIHLVSALDAGLAEIWSNDRHLLRAAVSFGLTGRSV